MPEGEIVEVGPGSGCLAADVLTALAELDALPARYLLLEVSPDLRERQRQHLAARVPEFMPRVRWIDALPERWSGAVIANEVLDAVPAHLVARRDGEWFERGVTVDAKAGLAFGDRPARGGHAAQRWRNRASRRQGDYRLGAQPALPRRW